MTDYQTRIQELKRDIEKFQKRHSFKAFDLMETEKFRLQLQPVAPLWETSEFEYQVGVKFPEEYAFLLNYIANGLATKYSSLLSLSEALQSSRWDIRANFPHTETWNPEYQGLLGDDSPESLGIAEYKRRQDWMMWWSDNSHINGTLVIEDIGCGYYRHLVLNGAQRGYLWEDLRAADEGITPTILHGKPITFLDFYEHEIRYNLRGLENEL